MPPQSQACQKIFSYNASHLFTESSPLQDRRDREQLTHRPQSPKVTAERSMFLARWSSRTLPFSASEPTGGGSLCDRPRETPLSGAVGGRRHRQQFWLGNGRQSPTPSAPPCPLLTSVSQGNWFLVRGWKLPSLLASREHFLFATHPLHSSHI